MTHKLSLSASSLKDLLRNNDSHQIDNSIKTTKKTTTTTTTNIDPSDSTLTSNSYWPSAFTYRSNVNKNTRSPIPSFFSSGKSELVIEARIESSLNGVELSRDEANSFELEGSAENQELDEIAASILYQAGADVFVPEGPLLVLAGSKFPSSLTHDHTKLLEKLRIRLETLSNSSGYSLVVLASATQNSPTTPLLVNSYLALNRSVRKAVRKVWVVEGGWWSRLILRIFTTTLISGKTAKKRKIVQCTTLSSLALELGADAFTQIEFPLEVYLANSLLESSITLPPSSTRKPLLYGGELDQTGESGLPRIFIDCMEHLNNTATSSPGIFRRSPSSSTLKILQDAYERGNPVTLSNIPDGSYLAASLLKNFLRRMQTPVFPRETFELIRQCPSFTSSFVDTFPKSPVSTSTSNAQFISYVRNTLLPILSPLNRQILFSLLALLHSISLPNETTLMDSTNLAIVLGPSLIGDGVVPSELEVLDMCRVVDWEMGTVNGRKLKGLLERRNNSSGTGGGNADNTVGGILRGMIECYPQISSQSASTSTSHPFALDKFTSSDSITSQISSSTSQSKISRSTSKSSFQELSGATTKGISRGRRGSTTRGEIVKGEGVMGMFAIGVKEEQ